MKIYCRTRVVFTIFLSCTICTTAAVMVAESRIEAPGQVDLADKSKAVLSRMMASR